MTFKHILVTGTLALLVGSSLTVIPKAKADETGAFIGGVVASRIMGNMRQRTQAEQQQAYYAQQQAQRQQQQQQVQQAPAQAQAGAAPLTMEQRLQQLDKLAANGYITKDEYKARRKAILEGS